jgi:hypothetical protein
MIFVLIGAFQITANWTKTLLYLKLHTILD